MVLCDVQFLRGYSLLLPDPVVTDLNLMNKQQRLEYLNDMSILGDALIEVTGSYRINYKILCNLEPALHAHIIPRYLSEPEEFRKEDPFAYDKKYRESIRFDYERDKELMKQIAQAVQKRL